MQLSIRFRMFALTLSMLFGATVAFAQYPRTVVIEEFTSVNCKPCTLATAVLNDLLASKGNSVVTIRNQVKFFPPVNPYSTDESEARKDYYDASALPQGRIDGASVVVTDANEVIPRVEDRLAIEAPILIGVERTFANNMFDVQVELTAGDNGLNGDYVIHLVAVEREIHDESLTQVQGHNGETTLHDVMRSMVNGIEGEMITLDPGEMRTLTFSNISLVSGVNPEQIYFVAFIQNRNTKEVVQGGFSPRPTSGVDARDLALRDGFSFEQIHPMPANTPRPVATFTLGSVSDVVFEIVDINGHLVASVDAGRLNAGTHTIEFDAHSLVSGSYSCVLRAGGHRLVQQIVVAR